MKKLGTLIVLAVLLVCIFAPGMAYAKTYWVLNAPATVYATTDITSEVVAQAGGGTMYTIIDSTEANHWIKIAYNDQQTGEYKEGWIKEDMLDTPSFLYDDQMPEPSEHQGNSRYAGNEEYPLGFVLCESLSVRKSASVTANRLMTIAYGYTVFILEESDGWYLIRYQDGGNTREGWVLSDYVLKDPQFYTTARETPAYAYGSVNAKKVGLIDAGINLPIIDEADGFYVVSLRGASAFIQK